MTFFKKHTHTHQKNLLYASYVSGTKSDSLNTYLVKSFEVRIIIPIL